MSIFLSPGLESGISGSDSSLRIREMIASTYDLTGELRWDMVFKVHGNRSPIEYRDDGEVPNLQIGGSGFLPRVQ